MKIEDIAVGNVYRGPRREESSAVGMFWLFREVTWTDEENVYFRRPLQFGECFHSKLSVFARWATQNEGPVRAEIAGAM